jgi:hypothetical protein
MNFIGTFSNSTASAYQVGCLLSQQTPLPGGVRDTMPRWISSLTVTITSQGQKYTEWLFYLTDAEIYGTQYLQAIVETRTANVN